MDEQKKERLERIRLRFKEKMNGLKLSKQIDIEQAKAIVWMLENHPDLIDCLYVKTKKVDMKKIESQLEQFKSYWVGPRTTGWAESRKALIALDLSSDEFTEVLRGIGREADYRAMQKRLGKWVPEWKHPAPWLRSRRWEAEFTAEKTVIQNPGLTAAENTAKMLDDKEVPQDKIVRKSFKDQLLSAQRQSSE